MQTIFEIFDCSNGKTLGLRHGLDRTHQTIDRCADAGIFDFLPWKEEGFFVVDMRDNVKAGPFLNRADAEKKSDFENMASDTNSFRVVEHSL